MKPNQSKSSARFLKNHITQHALLKMIGTRAYMLNKGNKAEAIVMDLSKAFDTLNHNLQCKNLKGYGFNKNT